ncbi:hypothetical protein ACRSLK_03180 [Halopseudomonas pachastrellae]|uniref:hypothetical protein n=1 Tax=Halopseudomonas pachastrellae TaxID=254161 RepID=UPI003D7E230A|tara:strand:- start:95 stop:817 length:723 start_codon:yes stop_codon:yes gene_type:complete
MKPVLMVLTLLVLTGCAAGGSHTGDWASSAPSVPACKPLDSDQELVANMAQQMVEQGQMHAALATLDQLPLALPEVRMRKARLMRALDMPQAEPLYRSLLDTCLVAQGKHGLGLLAAARNELPEAAEQLQAAVRLAPTDSGMRNDLGVLLMRQRQLDAAYFELMTALQLSKGGSRAADNLLALLLYQDRWQEAGSVANDYALPASRFQAAQAKAERMRQQDRDASVADARVASNQLSRLD